MFVHPKTNGMSESKSLEPGIPGKLPATSLVWLSLAFAEAAGVLCNALVAEDYSSQFMSTRVILHLCRHAAELFLKGAIESKTGKRAPATHRLDRLFETYRQYLSGAEFEFALPFPKEILRSNDDLFPPTLAEHQRTHDQRFRYPADNAGTPFHETQSVDTDTMQVAVAQFSQTLTIMATRIDSFIDL
jgi:hypothetical protein